MDADTLWMDFPSVLQLHFAEMGQKSAHFGLAEETYSEGSWYTIGESLPKLIVVLNSQDSLCPSVPNRHSLLRSQVNLYL